MARHFQITQKNKFAISLQYLTKEVSDEVDFFHAEEHEGFLQINTVFGKSLSDITFTDNDIGKII